MTIKCSFLPVEKNLLQLLGSPFHSELLCEEYASNILTALITCKSVYIGWYLLTNKKE